MKVLALTSALLVACSSAAAVASLSDSNKADDVLKAREAEAAPLPGFRYSAHGSSGLKRDADAAADPGWWGFRWSPHGSSGWKRDADAAADPGWWGFRWSRHGSSGLKRDVPTNNDDPEDDTIFIYLPRGMTPDDLAAMVKAAELEESSAKVEDDNA